MPIQKIERQELLHRCWEVFHRQGYHHTSVSHLAAVAGLGKAGLLHHFGSKEGAMHAVIEYAIAQFRAYVLVVAEEDIPLVQRLEKMLRRQNRLAKMDRRGCFFANMALETGREEVFNPAISAFYAEWQDTFARLLLPYLPEATARERAYQLLVEYEGAVVFYKLSGDEEHLERFVVRSLDNLKAILP